MGGELGWLLEEGPGLDLIKRAKRRISDLKTSLFFQQEHRVLF